jgi:hypothetical protein
MRNLPQYILEARGFDGTAGQEFDSRDFAMRNFDLFVKAYAPELGPQAHERLLLLGPGHLVAPPEPFTEGVTDAEVYAIVREVATELRAKAVLGA